MKNWNTPEVRELDVRMTASSGIESTYEAAGYLQNGWQDPRYDSTVYERVNENCYLPAKSTVQS